MSGAETARRPIVQRRIGGAQTAAPKWPFPYILTYLIYVYYIYSMHHIFIVYAMYIYLIISFLYSSPVGG